MGGGLMQLVAYGAQDVYLTGNPQITFFKVVYRRHTNFSMELIKQTLNGDLSNGQSDSASCTISRNGDLVHDMYIQIHGKRKLDGSGINGNVFTNLVNKTHRSIKEVSIEIGGQLIDRQSGEFMQLYSDLVESNPSGNPSGVNKFDRLSGNGWTPKWDKYNHPTSDSDQGVFSYYVPLRFWFCRNPGLALPLIALQYHEVRCNISIDKQQLQFNQGENADLDLWANYIYLDTDERRRFAQVSHEYLIEQVQNTQQLMKDSITSVNLNFNHPVKELMWCFSSNVGSNWHWPGVPFNTKQSRVVNNGKNNLNNKYDAVKIFGSESVDPTTNLYFGNDSQMELVDASKLNTKLILNGQDRFQERPLDYFSTTQIYKHHTGRGSCTSSNGTFCYSFALKPEEHQPSGTCNFSRIDSSILQIEGTDPNIHSKTIKVYAINYNVLRVMSGMGGLAYSN